MLRLVTWNLDGLDDRHLDERMEAMCLRLLLRKDPPDVLMLQEVVPRALLAHIRPHFVHAGYVCVPPEPPDREYFEAMLIRPPLVPKKAWRLAFPGTQMGRGLLAATVERDGRELLLATAHLESMRPSRAERMRQLALVAREIADHRHAIFAGDTNLRDDEVAAVPEARRIRDAWELAGCPPRERATWYPPVKRARGMRFDRVFVDESTGWRVAAFHRLGAEPVEEARGMRISDHLGLEVHLDG